MGSEELRSFHLCPSPEGVHEAREILARLSWYGRRPLSDGGKIILSSPSMFAQAMKLGAPFWMGAQAHEAYEGLHASVTVEHPRDLTVEQIDWCGAGLRSGFSWRPGKVWRLRPWADSEGDQRWIEFAESCAASRQPDNRDALHARLSKNSADCALLIGPGPSLRELRPTERNEITIMTLSALLNLPSSLSMNVDIVIFSDALATIGPSSVAQSNRDALIKAAKAGALLVTTAGIARILADQFPIQARAQIFGFEVSSEPMMADSQSMLSGPLPRTNNVLTMLGFPIAASFSKHIKMIGFDGLLDPSQSFEHFNDFEQIQRTTLLRAAHPTAGLKDNYYADHRTLTAAMMKDLIARGTQISPPPSERILRHASAPGATVKKDTVARRIYNTLDQIDRLPAERFVLLTVPSILIGVGALLFALRSTTLENLFALVALSMIVIMIGFLVLRRRQNRQIERLRHEVMVNFQEMNQLVIQRLEHLETGRVQPSTDE